MQLEQTNHNCMINWYRLNPECILQIFSKQNSIQLFRIFGTFSIGRCRTFTETESAERTAIWRGHQLFGWVQPIYIYGTTIDKVRALTRFGQRKYLPTRYGQVTTWFWCGTLGAVLSIPIFIYKCIWYAKVFLPMTSL